MANPASFSFIFVQFLQQIYVKNVHLVSSAGIQTRCLLITSIFPRPGFPLGDCLFLPTWNFCFVSFSWTKLLFGRRSSGWWASVTLGFITAKNSTDFWMNCPSWWEIKFRCVFKSLFFNYIWMLNFSLDIRSTMNSNEVNLK